MEILRERLVDLGVGAHIGVLAQPEVSVDEVQTSRALGSRKQSCKELLNIGRAGRGGACLAGCCSGCNLGKAKGIIARILQTAKLAVSLNADRLGRQYLALKGMCVCIIAWHCVFLLSEGNQLSHHQLSVHAD